MTQRPYRGKRLDNGEWVYGSLIDDKYIVGNVIDWNEGYFNTEWWYKVDPDTVGQYTGLTDDIGVKVFDGDGIMDIITSDIYTVRWDEIGAGFLFHRGGDETGGIDYYEFEDTCSSVGFRVIGNVHDHPHLLKGRHTRLIHIAKERTKMKKVNTQQNVKRVNGIDVLYSRIPSEMVEGFGGIVFYFQTSEAFDAKAHEGAVKPIIDSLIDQNYDHGTSWELTKCEAVVWHERSQVSVVSFRVRDSY